MKQDFHPDFIDRYKKLFSEAEFSKFLMSCQTPLRKAIRINTLKISEKDFLKRANKNEWILTKIPYVDAWYFIDRADTSIPLWKSIEYFSWLFYIQETSSMIPPMLLKDIGNDAIILDVSAAPGSKTTQIANYKNKQGLVIGNDIVAQRLKALKTNINYQWFYNCASSKLDWRDFGRYFKETFDAILLDAPCSGEWTMRKDEIRWSLEVIHDLAKLQKKLIISAIEALKIWGTLVYSTCTMTPEEDEAVLSYAKTELGEAIEIVPWTLPWLESTSWVIDWQWENYDTEVMNSQKIWPHVNDTEWFFIAKIIKKSSTNSYESLPYYQAKNNEVLLKWKELKALYSQILKRFGIDKLHFENTYIIKKWTELEIRTKQSKQFSNYAMIQNMWIPFWTIIDNVFSFSFYAAQVFWKYAVKNYIELVNKADAENFRIWKDLPLTQEHTTDSSPGQIIVTYDNIILWSSLLKKSLILKNQVPRETIKI